MEDLTLQSPHLSNDPGDCSQDFDIRHASLDDLGPSLGIPLDSRPVHSPLLNFPLPADPQAHMVQTETNNSSSSLLRPFESSTSNHHFASSARLRSFHETTGRRSRIFYIESDDRPSDSFSWNSNANPRFNRSSRRSSIDSHDSRGSASTLVAERDDADAVPVFRYPTPGSSLTWPVVNHYLPMNSHLSSPTQRNLKRRGEEIANLAPSPKLRKRTTKKWSPGPTDFMQDTFDGSTSLSQVPTQTSAAHATLVIDEIDVTKTILHNIFKTVELYKRLLSVRGVDAQKILDAFQLLLDNEILPDRAQVIAAMRRLSRRTQLYPSRFFLEGPSLIAAAEPVASGSFADIYKVISRGEELCYKVIRVYQNSQVEHIAKVYAREAILWGQLSHRNILPFYGLIKFSFGLRISFVSRWASNGNLEDYLTKHPEANRLLLCSDTAAGVEYLHKNDIVHGDLKGSNILIDSSGRGCIGDFGVSSVADSDILNWTSQSTVASQGGTIRFQAPELLGPEDTTKKVHNSKASDVFAWASICYETFTGYLPFYEVRNPATIVLNIMQGKIPTRPKDNDAAWIKHGLSNTMWELIEECWNFEPLKRPDMTSIILRLAPEQPVDLRPPGEWAKTSMRFRNAQDNVAEDLLPSLKEIESLLSNVVFRTKRGEH